MAESQDRQITLAGQSYTLRYSVRATLALKDKWGLGDDKASEKEIERRMAQASLSDFVTIIWAGLRTHHPELSEDQVLGWLDDGGLDGLKVAMQDTIDAAAPRARPKRPPTGQGTRTRPR